jgi:hypothetical protein
MKYVFKVTVILYCCVLLEQEEYFVVFSLIKQRNFLYKKLPPTPFHVLSLVYAWKSAQMRCAKVFQSESFVNFCNFSCFLLTQSNAYI